MDKPVAYIDEQGNLYKSVTHPENYTPLYKRQEWIGLTDDEIHEVVSKKWWNWEDTFDIEGFSRAIEAKLKEKNT